MSGAEMRIFDRYSSVLIIKYCNLLLMTDWVLIQVKKHVTADKIICFHEM